MSFDYNKWERELRSEVETHEFAFDESAWAEMDALLDQPSGTIAPKESIPPASAGRFMPWIITGALAIIIGLLSWRMLIPQEENTITLSSFTVTAPPKKETSATPITFENALAVAEAGNTTAPPNKQVFPADAPQETEEVALEQVPPKENSTPEELIPKKVPLADRSAAYLTPLLDSRLLISPLPTALDDDLPTALPNKRKRNRRTLYPDVIERY